MTPGAGQGTPFHENGGPDTRSVVKGESMYVEYEGELFLHSKAPAAINCSRLAMKANL
jgi:hypothetical protein